MYIAGDILGVARVLHPDHAKTSLKGEYAMGTKPLPGGGPKGGNGGTTKPTPPKPPKK